MPALALGPSSIIMSRAVRHCLMRPEATKYPRPCPSADTLRGTPLNDNKSAMHSALTKVPAVTLGFWIIKILATTLGETGGDRLSMKMDLGYLASTGIFLVILIALVVAQIAAKQFHPLLYWATIVASTTA